MEGWAGISLAGGAATGNLKQLYPTWAPVGVAPPGTAGQLLRKPSSGNLGSAQVQTDNLNGGVIELWDINGADSGANVSSLDVITNAQLVALQALGRAKLIWSQNFTASSGAVTAYTIGKEFLHGLAARYVQTNPGATCSLNLNIQGGFVLNSTAGA